MTAPVPTIMTAEAMAKAIAEMRSMSEHALSVSEKNDKALSTAVKPAMLRVAQAVGSDRDALADAFFMTFYRRRLLADDKASVGRQWNSSRTLADYHLKNAGLSCAWRKITNGDGTTIVRSLDDAKADRAEAAAKRQADMLDAQARQREESTANLRAKGSEEIGAEIAELLRMWSDDKESWARALRAASAELIGAAGTEADVVAALARAEADYKTIAALQQKVGDLTYALELSHAENAALTAPPAPAAAGKNANTRLHMRTN